MALKSRELYASQTGYGNVVFSAHYVPELHRMDPRRVSLTDRDESVLELLTRRVRTASVLQLAEVWWPSASDSTKAAQRSLHRLVNAGFLLTGRGMAHPLLAVENPVATWNPGQRPPDAGALAYQVSSRWTQSPQVVEWYVASPRAAAFTGGFGGRRSRTSELTHDLHLTAVYLRISKTRPELAPTWTSEAALGSRGLGRNDRLPDAVVWVDNRPQVVEFAGSYSADKLREFHEYCERMDLPYELW